MTSNVTAIDDVITVLVPLFDSALTVPVYNGPPVPMPSDLSFLIVGGDIETESDAASMTQEWAGLGAKTRYEELHIRCTAVGRATTYAGARALAINVIEQVGANLPPKPTSTTYNAIVDSVDRVANMAPLQSGVGVRAMFTITVKSRLQ